MGGSRVEWKMAAGPKSSEGARDAYGEVEALWRTVRDYESLKRSPRAEAPWRQELLEDPRNDMRCQRVSSSSNMEVFEVQGPIGEGVFLLPGALDAPLQRSLVELTLSSWTLPPNRSNMWPGPVPVGVDAEEAAHTAEESLRAGLDAYVHRGGGNPDNSKVSPEALVEKLRWVVMGRQYDWGTRTYLPESAAPDLAEELQRLAERAAVATPLPEGSAVHPFDAAICNFYHAARRPSDRLGGHRDDVEADTSSPLVTVSLGLPCIFLLGGLSRDERPLPLLLRSGTLLVMAGRARQAYHGVPTILVPPALQLRGRGLKRQQTSESREDDVEDAVYSGQCSTGAIELDAIGLPSALDQAHAEPAGRKEDIRGEHRLGEAARWILKRARVSFSIRSVGG